MSNYRSGRVSYDGNGMVGGSWWARDRRGHCDIDTVDIAEKVMDLLTLHLPDEFRVEASFEEGEDTSVGLGYYCDIDEQFDPEEIYEAIDEAKIGGPWKDALRAIVDAYIADLDGSDYTLEEED